MMQVKRGFLFVLMLCAFAFGAFAQSEDDFDVRQNANNTITITGYKGSKKDVVIPGTLYGLRVTVIGEDAFKGKGLTSVAIPNTVTTIGNGAFGNWGVYWDQNNFPEVVIPNSVTEIGSWAFAQCGITQLNLGTGVQTIRYLAFTDNKITELTLPASLRAIGEMAFFENQIKSLTIPNGVIYIGPNAFSGTFFYEGYFKTNPIETLVIPASLASRSATRSSITGTGTGIYGDAFRNCPITRITMPANMDDGNLNGAAFEQSFINFYKGQNKAAGTYVKRGPIWSRQ